MLPSRQVLGAFRSDLVVLAVVITCAAFAVALPLTFPFGGGPTDLDRAVAEPIHAAFNGSRAVYQALVLPSNGYIIIPLLLAAAVWFGYRGAPRRAAVMIVVPEIAVAVNSFVLKPLWDRPLHDYLAYPSGHTVHLVGAATTFVILSNSPRARVITTVTAVSAMLGAAIGMIGLDYHLATDILGGTAAAVAMVTMLCWMLGKAGLPGTPGSPDDHRRPVELGRRDSATRQVGEGSGSAAS